LMVSIFEGMYKITILDILQQGLLFARVWRMK